jgi:ribosome maturation factor RimP
MASTVMEKKPARTTKSQVEVKRLQDELEALKKRFEERLAALEAMVPKPEEQLSVETLAVISAAVTAFLGKKVKIRSAHLLQTTSPWAQAGRTIVMASHNLKR